MNPLKFWIFLKHIIIYSSKVKIFKKKIFSSDDIINLNDQIIGQKEISPNYLNLIILLENKIEENTFAKDYFVVYRNAILGKK